MTDPQVPVALLIVAAAALTLLRGPLKALSRRALGGPLKAAPAGATSGCAGCKVGCGKKSC